MVLTAEEENSKLHQKLAEFQKEKQEEISKSTQQQRGLVRRINYLIQEKEKAEQEAKERNAYVAKLELKLGKKLFHVLFLELDYSETSSAGALYQRPEITSSVSYETSRA